MISALDWAGEAYQHDGAVVQKILEVLTKAPGMAESRDIHHTILTMCAPRLKMRLRSADAKEGNLDSILQILDDRPDFTLSPEREVQKEGPGVIGKVQEGFITLVTSPNSLELGQPRGPPDISGLITRLVEVRGTDGALRALISVLLQLSGSHNFLFALDAITTAICMAGEGLHDALRLQYSNLGGLLKTADTLTAEAVVRLYRHVEAYKNLLTVQDMGLDTIFAQQLTNIDTADPNLDAATAVSGGVDVPEDLDQPDGIDQMLDEAAAMGNLDSNDADMNFDALYGLQGNDMDLNDLDLDMF